MKDKLEKLKDAKNFLSKKVADRMKDSDCEGCEYLKYEKMFKYTSLSKIKMDYETLINVILDEMSVMKNIIDSNEETKKAYNEAQKKSNSKDKKK